MRVVYWVRNDLRLHDNPALTWTLGNAREAAFVRCPSRSERRAGPFRRAFLDESSLEFDRALRSRGQALIRFGGSIEAAVEFIARRGPFDALVFNREIGTEEAEDEAKATAAAREAGAARVVALESGGLFDEADWPFAAGKFPAHFTEFRKAVEARCAPRAPLPAPLAREWPRAWPPAPDAQPPSEPRFGANLDAAVDGAVDGAAAIRARNPRFVGGESAGLARLREYLWDTDRIQTYKLTRDGLLDFDASTKLSPWIAAGCASVRAIAAELKEYEGARGANESTYWLYFELLWREYMRRYVQRHGARVFSREGARDRNRKRAPWALRAEASAAGRSEAEEREAFETWREGRTGQPFIDACMRELLSTGWLSGRGRQNAASYLSKTLACDWRWGADWFERQLVDYDVANNWGNWNYVAGVGSDPRDRVFNPEAQARTYDPDGSYVAKWGSEA